MIEKVIFIGIILVIIGIFIIIIGSALSLMKYSDSNESRIEGGGVIFIGPIPIVFGTNKQITWYMLVVGVVLAILMLILFLFMNKRII